MAGIKVLTHIGYLILIVILGLACAVMIFLTYRHFYKENLLLKIDPLGYNNIITEDLKSNLIEADIWLIGDSRIARWDEELIGSEKRITNLGRDGYTSAQTIYGFKEYLEVSVPDLVILEVGINDLKVIGLDRNLSQTVTENFLRNISTILKICDEKDIKVILINIFPVGKIEMQRRLIWNNSVNKSIIKVNEILRSYCGVKQRVYLDAYDILSDDGKYVNISYQADFLHLSEEGYETLTVELKKKLDIILDLK